MSTERKVSLGITRPAKKIKSIDLDTKMKVIKMYGEGTKMMTIARNLQISYSTVRLILKDKERIREVSNALQSTVIAKQRTKLIKEMEKLLYLWMEDQIQKQAYLSFLTVQLKAKSLFQSLNERAGNKYNQKFEASSCWFYRFKKRFQLPNVSVIGEAANANEVEAQKFVENLDEIITDAGYKPEQIFNAVETALFWKRIPERTCFLKKTKRMHGFEPFKDRLTLLLGGNIAGFKLKPFLIYSGNTNDFKNVNKDTFSVFYHSNPNFWMTKELFEDWFLNCFIPQVREYLLERRISFQVLLILDNPPGHYLDHLHSDVKVVYFPRNTSPLIQPMHQGSIAAFKGYYLRTTFTQAIEATNANPKLSLQEFLKQYNICKCTENIATAWKAVTKKCMNVIWKKCVNRYVSTCDGFDYEYELERITSKIVKLAHKLSLECEVEDVEEMLEQESRELTIEELITLNEERMAEEENRKAAEKLEEMEAERKLTAQGLSGDFSQLNKFLVHFQENYTNSSDKEWEKTPLPTTCCVVPEPSTSCQ